MKKLAAGPYMLTIFILVALPSAAITADDYRCKSDGEPRTVWSHVEEMAPNYPVEYRLKGGPTFRVPYAYFLLRPTPERVNCYPERDDFKFAFWMPSLAPSKKEAFYYNGWPLEEREPTDGAYFIFAQYVQIIPEGDDAPGFPFSSIEFKMDMYKERIPFKHALTRISASDFWLEIYVNLDEKHGDTLLECLNDGCEFTVYFRDLKLAVQGSFAKDKLPQWRAIKDGTRTLLERWMVRQP